MLRYEEGESLEFIRAFFVCVIISVLALTACSTTRQGDTEERKRLEAQSAELSAQIKELGQAREQWFGELVQFVQKAVALSREISLLKNHPGWPELEKIVRVEPSISYLEGVEAATTKTNEALDAWSNKWNAPGKAIYKTYVNLADRSRALETEKQNLAKQWESLWSEWTQARFRLDAIHFMRVSGTWEVKSFSNLVESSRKRDKEEASAIRSTLNSFGFDALGLCFTPTSERLEQMLRPITER